jgi:hypothetical protein
MNNCEFKVKKRTRCVEVCKYNAEEADNERAIKGVERCT